MNPWWSGQEWFCKCQGNDNCVQCTEYRPDIPEAIAIRILLGPEMLEEEAARILLGPKP